MNSVMATGINGIFNGYQIADRAAVNIAQGENLEEAMVDLLKAEYLVKASGKVIQTNAEMIGTLLDIKA